MLARGILGSGWTGSVSSRPFPNSSGWWWLISSVFLIRISCHKTTHANGYYGAWPGWAVSISVLPLTGLYRGRELSKWYHLDPETNPLNFYMKTNYSNTDDKEIRCRYLESLILWKVLHPQITVEILQSLGHIWKPTFIF